MSKLAPVRSLAPILLAALLALGFTDCGEGNYGSPFFHFRAPLPNLLTLTGEHAFELKLPSRFDADSLEISLTDEAGVTTQVTPDSIEDGGWGEQGVAFGRLQTPSAGAYQLRAEIDAKILFFFRVTMEAGALLRAADFANVDECEISNAAECLLPYPSSRFLAEADTPTGYRLEIPQVGIPVVNGPTQIPASLLSSLDGYSPTVQPLMHFPGGVDLDASGVSILRSLSNSGPPYVDIRTHDDSALDGDHPTVLLDWETGERLLHWVELDARADGDPDRQLIIMRPGQSLTPGGRYIVAVRDLVRPDGSAVEAEPAFAAIRDGHPTDIQAVKDQRARLRPVFKKLHRAGIDRRDLILAFEFTVQSEHGLTHQMLTMRDASLEWLDAQVALGNQTFTVDSVDDFPDCQTQGTAHRRIVAGIFQSPLYLDAQPVDTDVQFMNVDANDTPVQNGTMGAPYTVSIPCNLDDESHVLLLGHGIFGRGDGMVRGIPAGYHGALSDIPGAPQWNYISGATDWFGFSSPDFIWVGTRIVGIGNSQLHNFEAFPDRHKQGQANTLLLTRMMKLGAFNQDPAFQIDGEGVFPADDREQFYYGISMGGVQGLFNSAISQDIRRFAVDVPSINFSILLQHSTQFSTFDLLLAALGLTDPMQALIGIHLLHEVWVSAEPAGYATHITRNPLPDTPAKKMLFTSAWLDHQVPNQGSHISVRTL
ncbi:MAG: hypothetical protein GY937_19710 [bacterium]|nr:hypothetical protein [bacterium]